VFSFSRLDTLNATGLNLTVSGGGVSGANLTGGDLVLQGGKSTGNAHGGNIVFLTSMAGGSGSAVQQGATSTILTSDGYFGIGTSTPWAKLSVDGTAAFPAIANDSTGYYVCLNTSSGQMATSTTACEASSLRFKENVEPLKDGLADVLKLKPVSFDWKKDYISGGTRQIGFIAEDANEVIPEIIGWSADGQIANLDYPKLTAVLAKAVQELNEKVSKLTVNASTTEALETNAWSLYLADRKANVMFFGDLNLEGNRILDVAKLVGYMGKWSIDENGQITAKKVVAEELEVGSPDKPAGITIYDKKGMPGCIELDDVNTGAVRVTPGKCGESADIQQTAPAEATPTPDATSPHPTPTPTDTAQTQENAPTATDISAPTVPADSETSAPPEAETPAPESGGAVAPTPEPGPDEEISSDAAEAPAPETSGAR
jgi:Chaperone of endosialidase